MEVFGQAVPQPDEETLQGQRHQDQPTERAGIAVGVRPAGISLYAEPVEQLDDRLLLLGRGSVVDEHLGDQGATRHREGSKRRGQGSPDPGLPHDDLAHPGLYRPGCRARSPENDRHG
ncbi:MAG: hypothetical protein E6G35_03660 [Actinobacteria bacterium]|nr:MAG: hypothetical protein E6G35_03660 [Actinomycetota bacterium]